MVKIYQCQPCLKGDHKKCERSNKTPPGQCGGSKCICPCNGDPNYEKKTRAALREYLIELDKFEKKSRKANRIVTKKKI